MQGICMDCSIAGSRRCRKAQGPSERVLLSRDGRDHAQGRAFDERIVPHAAGELGAEHRRGRAGPRRHVLEARGDGGGGAAASAGAETVIRRARSGAAYRADMAGDATTARTGRGGGRLAGTLLLSAWLPREQESRGRHGGLVIQASLARARPAGLGAPRF